ncbi:hypothetical protein Nepgr_009605 [Nepenthes gracilis]|uniref:RING-type E3 ubiquitin transferase n=1 Tax=Nepenthes gracilis TaxID=150966 RepID=A0AAD3SBG9_NEPGR|nr:hypothetical protein Nepgr_009605 [Nepenthes gracilis]
MAAIPIEGVLPFIFSGVSFGILAVFLIIYCFCLSCGSRQENAADTVSNHPQPGRSPRGIDPSLLRTFPVALHSEVKELTTKYGGDDYGLECAVCLSPFQDHHRVRLLPICNHVFHPSCVDPWLAYHATCPSCQTNLFPETGNEESTPSGFSISAWLDGIEAQSGASGSGDGLGSDDNV